MAMERVTVEQNGERFTLEVPEGTSDDDIRSFLTQQQGGGRETLTSPGPDMAQNVETYGLQAAATPLVGGINYTNVSPAGPIQPGTTMKTGAVPYVVQDMGQVGSTIAKNATINNMLDVVKKYGLTGSAAELGKAILHPFAEQTLVGAAKNLGGGLVQGLTAPENLMTLPYNMAAYEQAKIRQNPNAPGLQYNPYAQTVRGEFPTQAAAGAANRRQAIASQTYPGLNPQEQDILRKDQELSYAMRLKAARKVLGQ